MTKISLQEGRRLFGNDPDTYARTRPDYPDGLYDRLIRPCGLRPGTAVLEVGPGTGIATGRLLGLGASPLRAIEPDPRLAAYLRETISASALEIDQNSFEEAVLPASAFDLGVAATSFHWLEQSSALAKVFRSLKPGGWWAMWCTHFGSDEPDPFQRATDHLFAHTPDSPSSAGRNGLPFALDQENRLQDLIAGGFNDPVVEIWRRSLTYETARLVDLYSTFSPIQALEPDSRRKFLHSLGRIADEKFGGQVERPFMTVLYTARRP
jgi:SAM-dependent methyltransferase